MYKVYANNELIYDSEIGLYRLSKGVLTLEINRSGTFIFTIFPEHPYYDKFAKLRTVIRIEKSDNIIFRGRVLNDSVDFWKRKTITCEGELSFLQDAIIRPCTFTGTKSEHITRILTEYNEQVGNWKRFNIGEIYDDGMTFTKKNDYENAFVLLENYIAEFGGYFYITHDTVIPTINYVNDFSKTSLQEIRFGKNLKDYIKTGSADEMGTAIIPLGALDEESGERLTIESVNEGLDYIVDETAVESYDYIYKIIIWDDITDASTLKTKGKEYLRDLIKQDTTIEMNAIDLHMFDRNIESFGINMYIPVISEPHNIDTKMLCSKQIINLLDPSNDSIVIGRNKKSFTSTTSKIQQTANSTNATVKSNTKTLETMQKVIEALKVNVKSSDDPNLSPGEYRVFGTVDMLEVTLIEENDSYLQEYMFEFIPSDSFSGLTVSPSVSWATEEEYPSGKTCQVTIRRGIGMIYHA